MALLGEDFHVLPAQAPVIRNALGGVELVDGGVTKPSLPAPALRKRGGEAQRLAGQHGRANGDAGHGLHTAGNHHVLCAAHHRLRGKVQRLLRRAALTVHRGARHVQRQAGSEPGGACDVTGQRANGVHAAEDDVVHLGCGHVVALYQRAQHVGAQVGPVHVGERALAAAGGRAQGVDDEGF